MKTLATYLLILLQACSYAQGQTAMRDMAYKQLIALSQGTLLVQLPEYKNTIDAMRKADAKKADQFAAELNTMHQQIISAFNSYYTYSKVYYFYASNTQLVIDKNFTRTILDAQLQPGKFVADGNALFIATFGQTDPDYAARTENYKNNYKANNISLSGLIIHTDKMVPCQKPFPYIIRTHETGQIISDKKIIKAVKQLQKKLKKGF
ncbi:MAG: hypothetical protein JNK61_07410 [Bacteroidia bacterium]|nr:hypothetical protein [Bacteroidia bacterium]